MAELGFWHLAGMALALGLVFGVSLYSGRAVKRTGGFHAGGGGPMVVAGAMIGTLVGGSATIGTAQLAYRYGFSAWWFTLGGGIACAVLGLLFTGPMRRSRCSTITGILYEEYGPRVGLAASLLSSLGTFINILSQMISATAILAMLFPRLSMPAALLLTAALMAFYVVFGGVMGAGMVGIVKVGLLYLTAASGAAAVLRLCGLGPLWNGLEHGTYFSLFARGVGTDVGAGLSLLLGVLSTQSYAQALMAGRTDGAARRGALLSACMIPPIGIGGILVGMYMRLTAPDLASAKLALPLFAVEHLPPLLAGVVLASLLIAVIGTGAGLALGISAVAGRDVVRRMTRRFDSPEGELRLSRVLILAVLGLACLLCMCPIGDTILEFAFMSMGLRGAVMAVPLCCALWLPGKVDRRWVLAAVFGGPLAVLAFSAWDCLPLDPLFFGVAVSLALCAAGRAAGTRARREENQGDRCV